MVSLLIIALFFLSFVFSLYTIKSLSHFKITQVHLPSGEGRRVTSLDGLRGILALGILFHHFVITYSWKIDGQWIAPDFNFFNNIGQSSVALFFMITGYLFLGRVYRKKVVWKDFYISRFFRVFPLYFLVIFLMVCLVLFETGFHLQALNADLLYGIMLWLTLQQITLNDFENTMQVTAGVTWTLKYEYLFYFVLPLVALFTKSKGLTLLVALFVLYLAYNPENIIVDSVLQFNSVSLVVVLSVVTYLVVEKPMIEYGRKLRKL